MDADDSPPYDPLAELMGAQTGVLKNINNDCAGISLQVEEIYDIVRMADDNSKEAKNSAKRETLLLGALVAVSDLLDAMLAYIGNDGAHHAEMINTSRSQALDACALERLGHVGERLDPSIHSVANAVHSDSPIESVVNVLHSGYMYRDKVLRKADVIISKGSGTNDSGN